MTHRVLLVEDEEGIRNVLRISLSDVGYQVFVAGNGREGLRAFRKRHPSIVVTDIRMPGMGGMELLQRIKQISPDTEVIMITGHGDMGLAIKSLRLGATDFITKPLVEGLLEIALKRANEKIAYRTQLREYTENLERLEEKYRTLFDYDPNSIFVLELGTCRILDVNTRGQEFYGYRKDELIGQSFMDLGTAEYPVGVLAIGDCTPTTLCSVYPKVRHFQKSGNPVFVNVSACRTRQSRKFGIIVTAVDITESVAKEAQLIQASKMATVGEMATGIAHELYQPLSAIQIGTDFFRNMVEEGQEISPEELVLVCRQMAGQAARAVHTVNHIRDLGRRSDGISEHVDVNEPIRGIAMLMNGQFKSLGVNVVLDLAKKLPPIIGESNRLEQMFLNLVMNAMDAMEDKIRQFPVGTNTLTIRSFEENAQVVVSVSDTGFGIPEDIKEKIFEPFFTTKQVGEGTGLGLSISYGTVKDYNGTIEVASQVGRGSTFKVTFPVSHY